MPERPALPCAESRHSPYGADYCLVRLGRVGELEAEIERLRSVLRTINARADRAGRAGMTLNAQAIQAMTWEALNGPA